MRKQEVQEAYYDEAVDYAYGSPHLSHRQLHDALVERVRETVVGLGAAGLPLTVLEVGAGHGGYTEPLLAFGCQVTAVEMSRPALAHLRRKFATNPSLTCVADAEGDLRDVQSTHSLLMAVSVLHHIPDYEAFLATASTRLVPGGSILTMQDPLWYRRMSRGTRAVDLGAYYVWRVFQGNVMRALGTLVRRRGRKIYDESKPADMVEYHVVRDGVDEQAIVDLLAPMFERVELFTYWSTQSRAAQAIGRRLGLVNTFGVAATRYAGTRASTMPER